MRTIRRRRISNVAVLLAAVGTVGGCDNFLTVENPTLVDAASIDPLKEAGTLALSVQQEFVEAFAGFVEKIGWFTGELLNADINPGGNYASSRNLDEDQGVSGEFTDVSQTRVLAELVIATVAGTEQEVSLAAVRAEFYNGLSFLYMGEFYCEGTVGGPRLSTVMMMDSAVLHLSRASTIAQQVGTAKATKLRHAGQVGIARAHLQAGRGAQAAAAAQAVPAGFEFYFEYSDDLANRDRVGNGIWQGIASSNADISVAPAYRNLNDPRVVVVKTNFTPFDGQTQIWAPVKYMSYSAPIRFASKIEADYIVAETKGTAGMLAFVRERRAANSQPVYDGPTDAKSVLEEFLEQKTRDLFLEAKRMGDYRRHPNGLRTMVPAGTPYHKTGLPPYKDLPCWPLPRNELDRNPNLKP